MRKVWITILYTAREWREGQNFEKSNVNYNFKELWCHYLDVTIQDTDSGKEVKERVWFEVRNNAPTLKNVTIEFPQSNTQSQGISLGAWLSATSQKQLDFWVKTFDPLIVKVAAIWATDSDWQISRYTRYYYDVKDPEERKDVWVTPGSVGYYTFSIPRMPGEYAFWVEMTDNDGDTVISEEYLGKWPVVTFTQQWDPDLPTMDLDISNTDIAAWEEVIFTMSSSVLSNRSDFPTNRYYKIDLDGDGIYDTPPLKDESYTHTYDTAGIYSPKAKVVYRERVGIDIAPKITVKQWVKHQVVIDSYDTYALIRNTSVWEMDTQLLCLDVQNCPKWSEFLIEDPEVELIQYPDYGTYQMRLISIDKFGNKPIPYTPTVDLTPGEKAFHLLWVPQVQQSWSGLELNVGSALDNTVNLYPIYTGDGNCQIDLDITKDSDADGDSLFDVDLWCNELGTHTFSTTKKSTRWNIYYVQDGDLVTVPLTIILLDQSSESEEQIEVPAEFEDAYNRIEDLISDYENGQIDDPDGYYFVLLENLRQSIWVEQERNSLVLQLHDYINSSSVDLPDDHRDKLDILLLTLTDETLQTALGGTEYDIAKANILAWFKNQDRENLRSEFALLEESIWNKPALKTQLDGIGKIASSAYNVWDIDETDFNDVIGNLCTIAFYYDIPTKTCGTQEPDPSEVDTWEPNENDQGSAKNTESSNSWWWFSGIIKWVIIGVVALILIFIGIVIVFAIKAKNQAGELDDEDEE